MGIPGWSTGHSSVQVVPIPSSEQRFSSRCYTPDQEKRSCRIVVFERLVGSATSRLDSEAAHSLTVVFTAIADQESRRTQTGCGHSDASTRAVPSVARRSFARREQDVIVKPEHAEAS